MSSVEGVCSAEAATVSEVFMGFDRVAPVRGTGGPKPTLLGLPLLGFVLTRYIPPLRCQVGLAPAP